MAAAVPQSEFMSVFFFFLFCSVEVLQCNTPLFLIPGVIFYLFFFLVPVTGGSVNPAATEAAVVAVCAFCIGPRLFRRCYFFLFFSSLHTKRAPCGPELQRGISTLSCKVVSDLVDRALLQHQMSLTLSWMILIPCFAKVVWQQLVLC